MERAAASAFCNIVFGRLFSELSKRYKISKDLMRDTEFIQHELDMLSAYMDDQIKRGRRPDALAPPPPSLTAAVARVYSKKMRELTHDIEDCVERFLHRVVTCSEGASWIGRVAHGARTFRMRYRFARRMKMYRERLEEERGLIKDLPLHGHGHGSGRSSAAASSADLNPQADADQPAGRPPAALEKSTAMGDLLAMLALEGDGGEQEMSTRVVAVVGFGGSGKTTLAWAAYCHPDVVREFPCRVWVAVRSLERRDAVGILSCIHQSLLPGQQYSRASLVEYLHDKRFLVVVDAIGDIEGGQWHNITSTLTNCRSSRIIVTTTFRPAAKRCSMSSGYVYKMRNLGNEHSMRIALGERCAPELIHGSAMLLEKCDGHPLALVSVADQLNSEDKRTGQFCAKLCRQLGSYLERENDDEPNFRRLRGVLADNYTALSDHSVRTCLLYLCIFPNDHPLRRNMIIRRWLAEGYSRSEHEDSNQNVADGMFDTFSDMNIIQPADTNKNEVANAYKTQRIMHEFLLQKSKSEKFVSTSHGSKLKKIRHISVHDKDDENLTMTLNVDLSCVRSLTVYGKAGKAISNFGKYKLMRVLDLDECSDVDNAHVQDICKLWNLRYLSLGASITRLPSEIAKLKLLQTLHLSKLVVNVLPVEVIRLPCLIHLIGKFKLETDSELTESTKLGRLPKEIMLETLAGFVTNGSHEFLHVMGHMKKLRKVKIWCQSTGESSSDLNNQLLQAIEKYTAGRMDYGDVRSLAIDFEGSHETYNHILSSENNYYLSSLKLNGNTFNSPEFVTLFHGLTKLCLSLHTVTGHLVDTLSGMSCLLYLRLVADRIDNGCVINARAFQSLLHLHFVVRDLNPILPEIREGALPELVSLQLPFKHLAGLGGINIRHLTNLNNVALHPEVNDQTRQEWEATARKHPNKPDILPLRRVDDVTGNEGDQEEGALSCIELLDAQESVLLTGTKGRSATMAGCAAAHA